MPRAAAALAVAFLLAAGAALAQGRPVPLAIEQGIRRVIVQAEIAETPRAREIGLMHRASLPEEAGMLFIYPEEQALSFWMKDTRIPLSIAFISAQGVITEILDMDPPRPGEPPRTHTSRGLNRYALEVNQGWFRRKGIEPGARVRVEGLGR
ncbi:MAG: DUF192 domain-containing protein [Candidatus Tectomicrobia bacterium]|nr:DUF192 domain-containing protein [Candidatus Tectomicrobia bacterium]MBI3025873.1 DUF192 domain-containing protein [Candidatus Tectomicrobia bacterium]